ncbi:MAG: U32 family peptidase C-terminal domain-containing protein [archaeon]
MAKTPVGKVTHFFNKISVAVVELKGTLRVGDTISIEGPNTNFTQSVGSMQVEHKNIEEAKAGESIGMKVDQPVKAGDLVFKEE